MRHFDYYRPDSLNAVIQILRDRQDEAKVMAGGTTLLLMMKQRLFSPEVIVDIKGLKDLDFIEPEPDGGTLRIGAVVTHRGVEQSSAVREVFPVLAKTAANVANAQIRNKGTLAGNLCQAEPASDPGTVLLAYDASVKLIGPEGARLLPLSEFFLSYYETAIRPDELLAEVQVPAPLPGTVGLYYKFTPRSYADKPAAGVAVILRRDPGTGAVADARIALGNCGAKPLRCLEAEDRLRGESLGETLAIEVGEIAAGESDPRDDVRASANYRRQMVRVLVKRALNELSQT